MGLDILPVSHPIEFTAAMFPSLTSSTIYFKFAFTFNGLKNNKNSLCDFGSLCSQRFLVCSVWVESIWAWAWSECRLNRSELTWVQNLQLPVGHRDYHRETTDTSYFTRTCRLFLNNWQHILHHRIPTETFQRKGNPFKDHPYQCHLPESIFTWQHRVEQKQSCRPGCQHKTKF